MPTRRSSNQYRKIYRNVGEMSTFIEQTQAPDDDTPAGKVVCPHCGRTVNLRSDGSMRPHRMRTTMGTCIGSDPGYVELPRTLVMIKVIGDPYIHVANKLSGSYTAGLNGCYYRRFLCGGKAEASACYATEYRTQMVCRTCREELDNGKTYA